VGELAVRPVDLAPLVEQGQNLSHLTVEEAVHRRPARGPVAELLLSPADQPPVRAELTDLQHLAGATDCPAGLDGGVDQVEQPGLGGRVDPAGDAATQPQPPFPSTSVNRTASSLHASDNRATSALACSSS